MKVSALVVLYFPDRSVFDYVNFLSKEFDFVVLFDNTPKKNNENNFREFPKNVFYLSNGENLGIATALNAGIDRIRQLSDYVVLFDQDSRIISGYKDLIFSRKESDQDFWKIALIGPVWRRMNGVSALGNAEGELEGYCYKKVETLITSGACLNLKIFDDIGRFCDEYFIDNVDHEYALRARKFGYYVVVNPDLAMEHHLGNESVHYLFGKSFFVTNHNPIRRYYITRNKLKLWRSYFITFPKWVLKDVLQHLKDVVKVFLFENQRREKFTSLLRGMIDGISGVSGPFNVGK